jgi:hypothetical protein
MTREGKFRTTRVLGFALLGYLLPVLLHTPYLMWHFPPGLGRALIPIIFLTMQLPVDPDWPAVLFFLCPINALLYGLIGLAISEILINRWKREE